MSIDATRFVWKLSKNIISPLEKLTLLAIADRCGERGECWPSIARICAETGLDRRSIMRHRAKFIKKGLLILTGETKGRTHQIPVMKLMVDDWREGEYIEDDIIENKGGHSVTGDTMSPVRGAQCHGYGGHSVTLNLKEEPKEEPKPSMCAFESFWNLYPSKKAKKKCEEIWKRRKLNSISEEIIAKLQIQIETDDQWRRGFIPNPTTYLNQDRWNDEPTISASQVAEEERQKKIEANKKRIEHQERISKQQAQVERDRAIQISKDAQVMRQVIKQQQIPAGLKSLTQSLGIKDRNE